jgi:putative transposase
MIRRVQISITESNIGKLSILDEIFEESKRVINVYIDELWKIKDFSSKFITFKVETWLSARLQQALGKQALEVVKSQRKKRKKYKPVFKKDSINLDSRFIEVQYNNNSFDIWFKLNCIGNKISLNLPGLKHKHYHKYQDWKLKKSCRLRKCGKKYFIDIMFEKESPEFKILGDSIGIDIGYKKLIATSNNKTYDTGLETVYNKISRKKQGSKAFKRSLKERDNKINESINKLPLQDIKVIIAEDLKNVKYKSKGKIFKKFNNKLQRWSYSKVLNMLSLRCEEHGIYFNKVDPAYTSQICSSCGFKHRNNRQGEKFLCLECKNILDADYNAAKNILALGSL